MNTLILLATAAILTTMQPSSSALAMPLGATHSAVQSQGITIERVAQRGGFHGGGAVRVNRGAGVNRNFNRNVNRNVNVNRNINRNLRVTRTVVRPGGWARPGRYWWRPGGAIAAGAAIGVIGAATAAAWAGAAPGPNMCWYYTDPSQRQGFWDVCQ
jgi:hypothetical protein